MKRSETSDSPEVEEKMKLLNYLKRKKCGVTSFSLLLYLLCCLLFFPSTCLAQQATPPGQGKKISPTKENRLEKIKKLKERVATKVAELRTKRRRAYFGKIKEISDLTITLATRKEEIVIKTGEETKIFRVGLGKRKKITLEDLKVGERIVAFGAVEKKGELTSKVIIAKQKPVIIHGRVTRVDLKGGIVAVTTRKRGDFIVDYEKTTKCRIFERGKGLVRGGLSKIKIDDRVHIVGSANTKDATRLTARRILVLPGKALGIVGKKEATPAVTTTPSPTE